MPPLLNGLLEIKMLCNLGLHTDHTLGRSSIRFKQLEKIKFNTPIAICENGNMSTLVKSLKLNKNNIPAVELFIIPTYKEKRYPSYRAKFFAFDFEAYKNLCKMIEIANRNKYYVPRIIKEDLQVSGDMIIIIEPDFLFYDSLPKDKTYVAVNSNFTLTEDLYNIFEPIFYYDSYALHQKDLKVVELLSARGFKHDTKCWYYDEDHYNYASFIPGAIENYNKLIAKANKPVVTFDNKYPVYDHRLTQEETNQLFDAILYAGFLRKCPQTQEYKDRLEYEVSVIKKLNYTNYFLVNYDFINWSRENNIPIGPGRGSAAGSIIAYCFDITKIDPIEHGLYFERFLNPERVSPPDIDTDIATDDRYKVVDYVKRKYGKENVSQIITFSELKSKSALKDAARLHENEVTAEEINKITSYFPPSKFGIPPTLEEAYEIDLIKEWASQHPTIWNEAKELEGYIRQTGIHAAGVIISPTPLNETVGIGYADGEPVCQLYMGDAEKFGLLKMDFLGLSTLGVLKNAQELLGMSYYDLEKIKLNDPNVINQFALGNTHGVFQFEGDGISNILRRIKPVRFADIAATNALYRPGPLTAGLVENYIYNKNSKEPIYFLPEFEELLAETYGIFAYQEQIMSIAQKLAGFTLSKADNLRRAIGKKNKELMKTMAEEFQQGCIEHGYTPEKVSKLWTQIVGFADYCFNKSHSYAYAILAYWCMYLKVYHPKEFAVSLLSLDMKDSTKLRYDIQAFKDTVRFLPPYLNETKEGFTLCNDGVMMGYGSLKGIGNLASNLEKNGPYKDIVEIPIKNKIDTSQFNALIYSGAFDKIEPNRGMLLANVERILKYAKTNNSSKICNL